MLRSLSSSSLTSGLGKLKRSLSSSGIVAIKDTEKVNDELVEEESGLWHYLVVDYAGIRERETAKYTRESKRTGSGTRHQEGAIVQVDLRRKAGWTRWLRCRSGGGWLFDVSPKDQKVRMVEVEVLNGTWHYQVLENKVQIFSAPAPSLVKKSTIGSAKAVLNNTAPCMVKKRVRPVNGKGSYLELSDGSGWVLDFVDGKQFLQRVDGPAGRGSSARPDANDTADDAVEDSTPVVAEGVGPSEFGQWDYIVLDAKGISLREQPVYSSAKNGQRIWEGEIVQVIERRRGDGIAFLKVSSPQGWAIDGTPGARSNLRMTEVLMERGAWRYRVASERGVDIRSRCSFSSDSKTPSVLKVGTLVEAKIRVRVGESTFLKFKDRDGWIFEAKRGCQVLEGPLEIKECPDGTSATICLEEGKTGGVCLSLEPTVFDWAKTNKLLIQGAKVMVQHTFESNGVEWARVRKPGGDMEGWVRRCALNLEAACPPTTSCSAERAATACFSAEQVRAAWNATNPKAVTVK